jgi:hypothetical protein
MTDKHTRRPWRIVDEIGGDLYVRDDGGVIAFCAKPMRWEGQDDRYTSEMAECCANASLITAAPDLLAALEAVMKEFGPGTMSDEAFSGAVAALSKAKGETT